jgi:hypothetical protein
MKKKRLLFISLTLALVLTTLMPGVTLAAKPAPVSFSTSGTISGISPGKVLPAGATGKWVVVERQIVGELSGDINGAFTMNYHAMVESIFTQAGDFHGWLTVGEDSYVLQVKGTIEPLEIVYYEPWATFLPKLTINGTWKLTQGEHGSGDFNAWVIFVPTPDGHVGFIPDSNFNLTGEWQP